MLSILCIRELSYLRSIKQKKKKKKGVTEYSLFFD